MPRRPLYLVFLFVAPLVVTVAPKRAGADSCIDECSMRYACDTGCCPDNSAQLESCSAACNENRYGASSPPPPPPPPGACGAGQACTASGSCATACTQDADCPLTTLCNGGACEAAFTDCTSALDCGPGQLCAFTDPNIHTNGESGICVLPCDATCADSRLACVRTSAWGWLYPPDSTTPIATCEPATFPTDTGAACRH